MEDTKTKPNECDYVYDKMKEAYGALVAMKPAERSELARRVAVTITEFEKMMGYYQSFVIPEWHNPQPFNG